MVHASFFVGNWLNQMIITTYEGPRVSNLKVRLICENQMGPWLS